MNLNHRRRGVILMDVILGTTLLVIVGVALVTMLGQNMWTVDQLRHREREIRRASQQLERMSALWSSRDFENHRGMFRAGEFTATLTVLAPNLYEVSIADSTGTVPLLRTTFYTADTSNVIR
jgi:hypothetical protein